jgi:hypothetical protein
MVDRGEMSFKGFTHGIFAQAQLVAKDGYYWVPELPKDWVHPKEDPGAPQEGPWLRERAPAFMPREVRAKAPLKRDKVNAGLHRLFASLEPSEKDVLRFAKKWGQLGRKQGLVLGSAGYAESLPYWQDEITGMQRLISLWELVRAEDVQALASYVRWQHRPRQVRIDLALREGKLHAEGARRRSERVKLTCPTDGTDLPQLVPPDLPEGISELLACDHKEHEYGTEFLADWTDGDVIAPARYYLHLEVNRHLEGHVSPVISTPDAGGKVEFWFVPDSLLASLYILFALELSDQLLPSRICRATDCRKVFVPATAKQKYCSGTCRIRADAQRRRGKARG